MRLYQSVGPNPRVVLMFVAEKGIALDRTLVDLPGGENRREPYIGKNPAGGTPLLELDDGTYLNESTAICEYLEELVPDPPLIGATPEARARTRAAVRTVDHEIVVPMANGFRSSEGLKLFEGRTLCMPDAAPGNKAYAADGLRKADVRLSRSDYLSGDAFTLADIVLFAFVEFAAMVGQTADPSLAHLAAWRARIAARPSAAASADHKLGIEEPA